ncbi:hypothetical protein M1N17_02950 [Dehalococcoidia bacterium]|nr:hypothetical protein [Dehalococcoidia bacterium]MCL0043384.1 hypothetical protein [Dehalococcoidia bacterium]
MADIEGIELADSESDLTDLEKDWYDSVYKSVSITELNDDKRKAQALDSVNLMRVWRTKGAGVLNRALYTKTFPYKYTRL